MSSDVLYDFIRIVYKSQDVFVQSSVCTDVERRVQACCVVDLNSYGGSYEEFHRLGYYKVA
jgi:uncharacterized protein YijF (DUF1287 family)